MKKLRKLRATVLTNIEAGQFVKRNLTDLATAGINVNTDIHIKNYTIQMEADSALFDNAMLQNHKNGEAAILDQLDRARDTAFSILNRQVKVYELSDVPAKVLAYKSFKKLFSNYKNLPHLNYEAETKAINHLLQELSSPEQTAHVNLLTLKSFITRLQTANEEFNSRFSHRNTDSAATTKYEAKNIRRTMMQNYTAFANYVVSLSNATNDSYYNGILEIINTNRKYYSDMLSKRLGGNKAPSIDANAN